MPAPIPSYSRPVPMAGGSNDLPDTGFVEGIAATFRTARDDQAGHIGEERGGAYGDLMKSLEDMGNDPSRYVNVTATRTARTYADAMKFDTIWNDVQAAKLRDPKLFTDVPADRDQFEQQWQAKMRQRQQVDQDKISRTGWAPWIAGGLAGSLTDPFNLALLPFGGGGGGLARIMARDALVNGLGAAVQQPMVAAERAAQGREFSVQEASTNILFGAGAGAVFGAGMHGAGVGLKAAVPAARSALSAMADPVANLAATHWDSLPTGIQNRWASMSRVEGMPTNDWLLADTAEAALSPHGMSDAERSAVGMLRREGQIDAANPFEPTGGGVAAHRDSLGTVIANIATGQIAPGRVRPRLRDTTAIASGGVPSDATAAFMDRVALKESGNSNTAVPRDPATGKLLSSASGLFQFVKDTWLGRYKARFGDGGLSNAEILAKRSDPTIQRVLMRDATASYTKTLRAVGEPVTAGNLYVMHFAGESGGAKLFAADPAARAVDVLGQKVVDANHFLRNMNVGDVLAWADRKMGGVGVARGDGSLRVADGLDADAQLRAQMQVDLDRLRLENVRRRAELGAAAPDASEAVRTALASDAHAVPVDDIAVAGDMARPAETATPEGKAPIAEPQAAAAADGVAPSAAPAQPAPPIEPRAFDPDAPAPEVLALLPQLRQMIDDKARKLGDTGRIAQDLGVDEQAVRRGLMSLVREGAISQRKDGRFIRKAPRLPSGPEDVLDFIARHGGIRDDEGHNLGLKTLSPEQNEQIISAEARRRAADRKQTGSRDWKQMTRRNGPLLRHKGRSIDSVGELLEEAGYLTGRDSARPTTAEVLAFLDRRMADGQPRYTMADQAAQAPGMAGEPETAAPIGRNSPDIDIREAAYEIAGHAKDFGLHPDDLDDEFLDFAARRYMDPDLGHENPRDLFAHAVNDYFERASEEWVAESGDAGYGDVDHDWPFDTQATDAAGRGEEARAGEARDGGSEPVTGESAAGKVAGDDAGGRVEDTGPELGDLPHEEVTRFLDPHGEAATAQAESLLHDGQAHEAFMSIWRDPTFKRVMKGAGTMPHRESSVAADMVRGWQDGLAGDLTALDAEAARVAKGAAHYQPDGFNPGQGYVSAFLGAITGATEDVRSIPGGKHIGVAQAVERIKAKVEGEPVEGALDAGAKVDPAIADRQRQEAQLAAEAPMRGENRSGKAQDGTMGLGLFDAADAPTFRFSADGPEMTLADLLRDIDEGQAEIDTIRSCMLPMPKGTE